MGNPQYSTAEPPILDASLEGICNVLLGLGTVALASSLYLGFVQHANSAFVFGLLGVTTVMFAIVLVVLLKPGAFACLFSAKSVADAPEVTAAAVSQPEPEVESPAEPAMPIPRAATNEPANVVNTDLVKLLDTTLGDILLTALRRDPEGAGRIFASAITQADSSAPAPMAKVSPAHAQDSRMAHIVGK